MSKLEVGDVEAGTGFIYAGLKNKEGSGDNTVTTISGKDAVVTIKGAKDRSIAVAGLTLEKGASLTINNTAETDTRIFGYAKDSGAAAGNMGAMVVDGSTIVGNKTAFQFNTVEIKNGSNITIGGILDTEKDNLKNGPEWSIYSNIGANTNGGTSGAISVKKSTITLNDESNLVGKDSVTLEGATINFAGKKHKDGFSTANIVGLTASTGEVVLDSGTKLNVNGYGAVYSDKITVKDASATINSGELFLDGMWTDSANSGNNKHNKSAINIGALTVDGTGTLVLGNAASGGTTTISGSTVINSKLVNNTAVTVSGASAVLELEAANIKADTGLFASKSGTLTISGGKLKLTNLSETLDLANAKQIKFAGTAAQNVVKVDTSGTIDGDNLAISEKIADIGSVNLSVKAKNLTLGKDGTDASALDLGIGTGTLAAENVTFKSSANKAFGLQNALTLNSTGNASINGAVETKANGKINITGGNYTLNNGLKITAGDNNVGLAVTNASLKILGAFETTATAGTASLTGANVDASEATSYKFGASTIKMADSSTLALDGSKWFELGSATGDLVKFKANVDAKAVSGDKISTLKLTGITSMTMDQFKELKSDTGFAGLFDGFTVTSDQPVAPSIGMDLVESGTPDSVYQGTQATVGSTGVADKTASVGSVQLSGTDTLTVTSTAGSNLTLTNASANNNANKNFVQKEGSTEAAGVSLSGTKTNLMLQGEGNIGSIAAANANDGALVIGNLDGSKTGNVTVKGNIGETNALGKVQASDNSNLTVAGSVNAKELTIASGADLKVTANAGSGSISAETLNVAIGATIDAAGQSVTVGGSNGAASIKGDVTAGSLVFSGSSNHVIAGNANVDVETLNLSGTGVVQVGDDSATENGSATVVVDKLVGTGLLFVDPSYQQKASLVIASSLSGTSTPTDKDAGTLQGGAVVGKNAALGIGFASEAELNAVIGTYLDAKGAFTENADASKNQLANALVLDKKITVASGKGITVSTSATTDTAPSGNSVTLEAGAGLIITDNAFDKAADGSKTGPAIKISDNAGTVTANANSALVLVGDFTAADKNLVIFDDNSGGATVTGTPKVVAAGGLLVGTLGTNGSIASLALDPVAEKAIRSEVSASVGQLFVDFANGKFDGATGAGYDFVVDAISYKQFKAVDAAAHAATYAGAQQAAVVSVTTMADAMFGRVGAVGVEAASISATGSQANGGVWLTPMYKSMDADGFNAEGVSYGSDVDAAGVAFGADTVNGNMRFGAVFNIGSGDAEGKGQGNGLKDEFDYYGFGIYSAMGFGNLALIGDASMTVVSHDVQGLGLRGKADTTAVTMGITGQYTVSTPMVDVTPHLGARFIRLNTDSYDLVGADGAIATTDFDVQNVFSVPLGVTLSKGFTTGGWTLAPSADLTITFNGGDTEAKSSTTFTGIKAINMNTEVLDEVTYGLTLGLGAQSGAFGTSFGINYTGSENTDSFGVNAQCRYMF